MTITQDVTAAPRLSITAVKQYANEVRYNARYGIRRWRCRDARPVLTPDDARIVNDLIVTGAHVTTVEALCSDGSAAIMRAGDILQERLARKPVEDGRFTVSADQNDLSDFPELVRWGLNERALAIVRAYIGLPIAYRGLTVRRDIVGGPRTETRMWHRDNEDNRIVKFIVYLNDVDAEGGPFEYIPRDRTPPAWRVPVISSSRAGEAEMERMVPPSHYRACTGPRGTVVIVDTCRVFHRGRVASTEDRRTLFYCYNSQMPISPQWCGPLFERQGFLTACPDLTPMQQAAIDFSYRCVSEPSFAPK